MLRSRSPLLGWLFLLLLLGCGTRAIEPWLSSIESKEVGVEILPSWPPAANSAHVTYLGTIDTAATFEGPPGFWKRIWSILSGSKETVGFIRPAGLCLSGSMLVVADPGASLLHLLDLESRRWRIVGDTLTGRLVSPVDVACLPDGRILTSDSNLNILFAYDHTGTPIGQFGPGELMRPTGMAFDSILGRVWLTRPGNRERRVQLPDPNQSGWRGRSLADGFVEFSPATREARGHSRSNAWICGRSRRNPRQTARAPGGWCRESHGRRRLAGCRSDLRRRGATSPRLWGKG